MIAGSSRGKTQLRLASHPNASRASWARQEAGEVMMVMMVMMVVAMMMMVALVMVVAMMMIVIRDRRGRCRLID